ncbi:MAG: hypothetical protein L0H54_12080, partial [Alcaligenaceae bacterium]|nr:hypothetical protein [Alcaligenaceae bacterium]
PKYGVTSLDPIVLRAHSPGGGGYGNPFDRDPVLVARDVRDGVMTIEQARQAYGVVVGELGVIDFKATEQQRTIKRNAGHGYSDPHSS